MKAWMQPLMVIIQTFEDFSDEDFTEDDSEDFLVMSIDEPGQWF